MISGIAKVSKVTSTADDVEFEDHESALVNNHLYLFGGATDSKFFPRNIIWVMNLGVEASKRKWVHRLVRGQTIPPSCTGARCVVINEMIYSYGGMAKDCEILKAVYCLDPKSMKWIEVDIEGKPAPRARCCLCVIGSRIIMFGGHDPGDNRSLQSGANEVHGWNNEIYKVEVDNEGRSELNISISIINQSKNHSRGVFGFEVEREKAKTT